MPELPEVEVVRRDLDAAVRGARVVRVEVGRERALRREGDSASFARALCGRSITACGRVGKFLVVHLADETDGVDGVAGAPAVVVHLGMSGQLRLVGDAGTERPPHTHVVWALDDGRELRFVDPRTFGQMFRSTLSAGGRPAALTHLGPDALAELPEPDQLARGFFGRRAPVKVRLMDQRALAGLGNIYSDEICFHAGIRGARPAGSLTDDEVVRLHAACTRVLLAAIEARGSSLADAQYVDLLGRPGSYQHQHAVHARAGLPCPVCGARIARERFGKRSGYGCPRCQR